MATGICKIYPMSHQSIQTNDTASLRQFSQEIVDKSNIMSPESLNLITIKKKKKKILSWLHVRIFMATYIKPNMVTQRAHICEMWY